MRISKYKDAKVMILLLIITSIIIAYDVFERNKINRNPIYIFAKIIKLERGRGLRAKCTFTYEGKLYNASISASGPLAQVGCFYMIKFQKNNPTNSMPIFDEYLWHCKLTDSSYYIGSPKKPKCDKWID
jgi:hypothetical protein